MENTELIVRGMHVLDLFGNTVGTVADAHSGEPDCTVQADDQQTGSPCTRRLTHLLGEPPGVTEELADRMLRFGFIQIDRRPTGLGYAYAATDDITDVTTDAVHLGCAIRR